EQITKLGKCFVESMNSVKIIILNGTRGGTQFTYDHISREAKCVIDFVRVDQEPYKTTTDIEYKDYRNELETDHMTMSVHTVVETEGKKKKKKKRRTKDEMRILKRLPSTHPFWGVFEQKCEEIMGRFETDEGTTVEQDFDK